MQHADTERVLTCWLLDTRPLWPGQKITDSAAAREALTLVSDEERDAILRKYRIADARMSLGSALLKRLFVLECLGTKWQDIKFGRSRDPRHGKPYALLDSSSSQEKDAAPLEFNISHQAGLVALVGCKTTTVNAQLGVDIVCVNERNDYREIDKEGFHGWIDIYAEIFSKEESEDMKYTVDEFSLLDSTLITPDLLGDQIRCVTRKQSLTVTHPLGWQKTFSSDALIGAKLRRFYTFWCYKEAYVKLNGEALLAKWIPQLEFKKVRAPKPSSPVTDGKQETWGERVTDAEVWWSGPGSGPAKSDGDADRDGDGFAGPKRVERIRLEIQAFEDSFMIAVAAQEENGNKLPHSLTNFTCLDLERDILPFARAQSR